MGKVIRFTVSINKDLINQFDKFIDKKKYINRSEAIRDLIRNTMEYEEIKMQSNKNAVAVISFVYNHNDLDLPKRLTGLQHKYHNATVFSTHIHLDYDNCLEVLTLKGKLKIVKNIGEAIIGMKGIIQGKMNLTVID